MYWDSSNYYKARELEKNSQWREASELWRRIGRIEDANACDLIADAIEQGDKERAKQIK